MVTKKARTEYMKKFRDPKWETFSKCYEDSLKYRLTRRVMESSHKPWFWEGWDSGSDSSGWSTPRLPRNRVAPLSVAPPPPPSEVKQKLLELRGGATPEPPPHEEAETRPDAGGEAAVEPGPQGDVTENGVREDEGGGGGSGGGSSGGAGSPLKAAPPDETATDNGPADSPSPDAPPPNPLQKRRHRRRAPRSEPEHWDSSHDDARPAARKPPRAKSQPPCSSKDKRWSSGRLDWRTANDGHTSDAAVQTRRESAKRVATPDRRRARSADLEKMRRPQLSAVEDRWVTEYMRCFSARLR